MADSRPTKKRKSALDEDVGAVDAATLASTRIASARHIAEQSLDLCSLTKPYDFAFLQKCMLAAPRVAHVEHPEKDEVVPISRGYEERFLHEQPHCQPCRMGADCEGLRLHGDCEPFVLPEFLLPGQAPMQERQCCLLCLRKQAADVFYATLAEPLNQELQGPLLPFCNIVEVPGEYRVQDTLVAYQHEVISHHPIVKHMRSAYTIERVGGQRRVVQALYSKPENAEDGAFFRRGASADTACRR